MNTKRSILAGVGLAVALSLAAPVAAQNPFTPPTAAMDELNAIGSPAPAAVNPFATGGDAAAPAANPFGTPAATAPAANPFGAGGGDPNAPAPNPFGAGGGAPPPGAPVDPGGFSGGFTPDTTAGGQPILPPLQPTTRVLVGERHYCAVTKRLLEDARWQFVWTADAQKNFYDDGTHGDVTAGDQYYSYITESESEMSAPAWRIFLQTKQMIRAAAEKDPIVFFKLVAITTDPESQLPKLYDKERDQDGRVLEWNSKFLREYRVDPDNDQSAFFKPHIPLGPLPPDVPPPQGFVPPQREVAAGAAAGVPGQPGARGDGFDQFLDTGGGLLPPSNSSVTGTPANPAASSNYFSTTAVGGGGR